jgi:hypothetical protein
VSHLGFERGFHRLNKIAAYGLSQGFSRPTAASPQRGSDAPNCVLCDGRVSLGPLRLRKPIRSRRSQLAGSTAGRGGSDLQLPKPSKEATLCPQLPGIWGTSVGIHRCQDSLMRHQGDHGYPNEGEFCHVQNSAQQLSRRA